jgi:T5SS/PEP-CTERM-associated repeat protein
VWVSGAGSVWSNQFDLVIGIAGASNSLVIADAGEVFSDSGIVGYTTSNNSVLVSGPGSQWKNTGTIAIGGISSGNSLVISNGGEVVCSLNYSGCGLIGGTNNTAVVVDGGVLRCSGSFWIGGDPGSAGLSNSLVVAGGSTFASNLFVACGNLIQLDSGSILVTNSSVGAVLQVRGRFVLNGGVLRADRFVMTNACAQFVRTGGTLIYGTAVLDPNTSAVGDGIPNGWKQQYGLDPFDPNLANENPDGDGMNNLQEYLAGTDPTNSASAFLITSIVRTNNDLLITWTTAPGKTNALERTSSATGAYTTNNSAHIFTVTTTGATTNYLDVGGAIKSAARYYRVRLVP